MLAALGVVRPGAKEHVTIPVELSFRKERNVEGAEEGMRFRCVEEGTLKDDLPAISLFQVVRLALALEVQIYKVVARRLIDLWAG